MYDWNDLKVFLAVSRAGSTLGAARLLNVNQSTVARRVDALERALGTQLFERRPDGYRLTGNGREILPIAVSAEIQHIALNDVVAARSRAIAGTIRVTTTELLATMILTPLVSALRQSLPDVKIELFAEDQARDLMRSEADVAIRMGAPPDEPSLIHRNLGQSVWGLFAARSYVDRYGLPNSPEDLADHAIIGGSGNLADLSTLRWLAALAPNSEVAMRCNSVPNLIAAVRSGVGIGPLPCLAATADSSLVRCLGPDFQKSADIWLIYHESQRQAPHIRAFVDAAVGHFASMRDALQGRAAH